MSGQPERVLVVAPNWLGDAVMSLPALADIKRHFSDAQIVVAARGAVADLFNLSPIVDEVMRIRWRGELFSPGVLRHDADEIRRRGASVAVLLPNSFASAWLVRRAGVAERWGYATDVRTRLLTRAVRRPRGSRHQSEYYQHLIRELGMPAGPLTPELHANDEAIESARTKLRAQGWDGTSELVTLAPGAAYGRAKQWLPAHVVRLVATLTARDATCVLVGSRDDASITRQIRGALAASGARTTIDLAGQTTLADLAGVFALSRACVSNDSGAMHLAAALGTPVVALFGPTIDAETRPLTASGGWARVLTSDAWCRPCMLRECPLDHRCMAGITPDMVMSALGEIPSSSMPGRVTE